MNWAVRLAAMLICAGAQVHPQTVRLAAAPQRETVTLLLGAPPAALIQETREVDLPAGTTTLALSWAGTRLVADSLELSLADAAVRVSGPILPAGRPQQAEWSLDAPQAVRAAVTIRYLMDGLAWQPEYTLVLDTSTGKADLSALAVVRNDSGEDFDGAQVDLGLSAAVRAKLKAGATLRLPYVNAAGVAYKLLPVYDGSVSPDTQLELDLENTVEAGLGVAPLPPGKMRLYEEEGGQRLLTGEVLLPQTPVGARAKVMLGTAREITVERRVLRLSDVDVKRDVHGRVALYNREEEIAFVVESRREQDVLLKIVETIDGEWDMLANSHEFERRDASHLEFVVPIAAHSELTVKYKVRRLHLLP